MRPTEKTPRKLKFAIDVKARDICTRPGDVNAAEVDLLWEGLVLKLDGDLITEEAGRDSDREGKSFWSIHIKVSLETTMSTIKKFSNRWVAS